MVPLNFKCADPFLQSTWKKHEHTKKNEYEHERKSDMTSKNKWNAFSLIFFSSRSL